MKKMRKAKVITALALTVVMLAAMTGIAAAESLKILDPATNTEVSSIDLAPGSSVTYDLKVGPFGDNVPPVTHTLTDTVIVNSAPVGGVSDITVEYQEQSPSVGLWSSKPYQWTQETGMDTYETLKVRITLDSAAPHDAGYTLVVTDISSGASYEIGVASLGIDPIPEFATIAIPVAGILGLVFFFNHRKRRKE